MYLLVSPTLDSSEDRDPVGLGHGGSSRHTRGVQCVSVDGWVDEWMGGWLDGWANEFKIKIRISADRLPSEYCVYASFRCEVFPSGTRGVSLGPATCPSLFPQGKQPHTSCSSTLLLVMQKSMPCMTSKHDLWLLGSWGPCYCTAAEGHSHMNLLAFPGTQ